VYKTVLQTPVPSIRLAAILAVLALIQPVNSVLAAPLLQEQQHAVAMARAGDTSTALTLLEHLYLENPANVSLRNDYAVIAAWNGNDALSVKLLEPVDPATLPGNVLAVYAKSLRNLGEWHRSLAMYDRLIMQQPDQLDGYLGRVMVLADSNQFVDAEQALNRIPGQFETDARYSAALLLTHGYVAERQGQFTKALGYYNKGLRAEPDNRELRKQRAHMASALGAGEIALREAQSEPGLFNPEQLTRFQLEALALQIRWAGLPRPTGTDSSAEIAIAGHEAITPDSEPNIRHRQYDYIVALTAARRMPEAVAQFEKLRDEVGVEKIPYYVLSAAGRAYLYLEESQQALNCYLAAQKNLPENASRSARFNVEMGLFYALTDTQQFDAASALINEVKAQEKAWIRPTAKMWLPNDRYAASQEAAAMSLAYREDYDEALEQLDQLIAIAPANNNLRMSRASVARWRGWYRSSDSDLDKVNTPSAQFSKSVSAAHLAMDTQAFEEAHDLLQKASASEPDAKAMVDLQQRWDTHQRSQLFVDAAAGESDGAELGNDSYNIDTRYYTKPLNYRYRLMVHDSIRYANFDEGTARDHRLGAGLEYREQFWTVTSEVNKGLQDNDDTGASLAANWQPTDQWYLGAQTSYNSYNVPLQAVEADISANDLALSARYRSHESRETSVFLGAMDFEDGNLREWLGASYSQRVLNRPHHKLRASVSTYFSRNSEDDAPYFNPSSDSEVTVGLEHEWRIFRDYDRSLVQRAGIYAGIYDQESYGSDSLWRFRIEHEWEISDRLNFSYGFDIARRPYDGNQEEQKSIFISLGCRL
jgi:biofilm PGA synthesis protein PgaA